MQTSFKIRDIEVRPGLVLAPMSGVTTSPFRRLLKELNPDAIGLVVTEFISVEAMTRRVQRSLDMMRFAEYERPFSVQIFGYDPDRMRDAALMAQDAGADIVDINCGCPAPKVVRKGGGCELMRQPDHLKQIIKTVRPALKVPLTMKIRAGWDAHSINAREVALMAESEGIEALAVHGRTRAQMYRGDADWSLVDEIASLLKIPVLGSGDISCAESARARVRGRIAGALIGRGAMANPFIFTEVMTGSRVNLKDNPELVLDVLERYVELMSENFSAQTCVGKIKQLASQMCRGYPWRKNLCMVSTLEEQKEIIARARDGAFSQPSSAQGAFESPEESDDNAGAEMDCNTFQC